MRKVLVLSHEDRPARRVLPIHEDLGQEFHRAGKLADLLLEEGHVVERRVVALLIDVFCFHVGEEERAVVLSEGGGEGRKLCQ